jgi:hypothetical protein
MPYKNYIYKITLDEIEHLIEKKFQLNRFVEKVTNLFKNVNSRFGADPSQAIKFLKDLDQEIEKKLNGHQITTILFKSMESLPNRSSADNFCLPHPYPDSMIDNTSLKQMFILLRVINNKLHLHNMRVALGYDGFIKPSTIREHIKKGSSKFQVGKHAELTLLKSSPPVIK